MARTPIAQATLGRGGVTCGAASGAETTGDAVNHHVVTRNEPGLFLHVRNTSGSVGRWFDAVPGVTFDGVTPPNKRVTVAANQAVVAGPYPVSMYGADLNVNVEHSDLRLRAYRMNPVPDQRRATPPVASHATRVALPLHTLTRDGLVVGGGVSEVTGNAALDHYFPNDGQVFLWVRAISGDPSYGFVSAITLDGQAVADYAAAVLTAANTEFAGNYPPRLYSQPDGSVYVNVTSANIALRAFWVPLVD